MYPKVESKKYFPLQAFREQNYSTPGVNRGSLRGGHGSAAPSASGYHNQHNLEYRQGEYNDRGNFRGRGGHSHSPHYSSRGPPSDFNSEYRPASSDYNNEHGQQEYPQGSYDRGNFRGRGGHSGSLQPQQPSDFDPEYQQTNTSLYNRPPPPPMQPSIMPKTESRGYLNANFQPNLTNEDDEPSYDDSKVKLDWCKYNLKEKLVK